ncbi:hypothetical protein e1116g03.tmp0131 [Eimeria tenella]|uniref:Uncharacterized protein n=1 Tax=Eimeria tenella TaxID=5802 RepID=C8TE46_EIMTE|nr:hypothetical protein e1116g03.tmp0131 [Eimeria tenella]
MARAGQESIRFRSSQEPAREYSTFSIQCKLSLICMEVAQLFQATEVHQSCSEMMPSFETRKAAFRNTCVHHRQIINGNARSCMIGELSTMKHEIRTTYQLSDKIRGTVMCLKGIAKSSYSTADLLLNVQPSQ